MKKSAAIKELYKEHLIYKNRLDTDELFNVADGAISLKGNLNNAIRFIEDKQLLAPALWEKFVTQFRDTTPKADDADIGWRGEYWGKMMRGACFTYAYTKNEKLYKILTETVKDMMTTHGEGGRISSYSVEKEFMGWDLWSRKYVLLGMQYFLEICKDKDLADKIIESMCRQADYMINLIGSPEEGKRLITQCASHWKGLSASSILEPFVRLYNITGYPRYRKFASYIVECGGIYTEPAVSIFELAYEDKLDPYQYPVTKAYEMMSCFEGLLEYYRVTKIEKWKTAVINFANRVRTSDITVIGCSGCTHELFDHSAVRQTNTIYNGALQETCVTVTWMKFCFQLLSITGNPVFADEIEKSAYNALLGSINFELDMRNGGLPFDSYSPLLFNTRLRGVGGKKIMADGTYYGCCACIGSAGTGIIGRSAVMLKENGIVINLFEKAKITTKTPSGKELSVSMETEYPADGTVNIQLENSPEEEFTVSVRIPEWSKNTIVSFNGASVGVTPGSYAAFKKVWTKGDYITLKFDMRCKIMYALDDPEDKNSAYHVALRRGPLALARDSRAGDIENVVKFAPDADGYVPCVPSDVSFEHFHAFKVTEENGNTFDMVDYASAGRTWDERSLVTVWMPTVNYWSVDLSKPITIDSPNYWNSTPKTFYLNFNEDGLLAVNEDSGVVFTLEAADGENLYRIKNEEGKYLALTEDKKNVTLSDEGEVWRITHYAQNKYRIFTSDGLALNGSNATKKDKPHTAILGLDEPCFMPYQQFAFKNV